jgi:CBS domain-containing protein|tara:strand:- start:1864 stop:2295 length:432 start_codon:yes stop_codon:yes gene_type:complete
MAGVLVKSLSQRKCYTIELSASIQDTANKLTEHNIGVMPVVDNKSDVVGIVSERDVSRYVSTDNFNLSESVSKIMSKNIISCDLEISVSDLMETMTNQKIRHMPIIDNSKLIGIVSIGDVVNHIIHKYEVENDALRNYINGFS